MKTARRRPFAPTLGELEGRCLLSTQGPSGTWIGQDGHDYVGPSSTPGPDQVQDIHIAVSGLPTNLTVTQADIRPYGGGEYMYNGPSGGPWAAAWVQAPGATTADLYLDPYQTETGRPFGIDLTYSDGTRASFWVNGGTADPNLRMPGASVAVQWVGQDGSDLTGQGPDVGPDGFQDVHLALSNLSSGVGINSVTVSGAAGEAWQSGVNPVLDSNAELVPSATDPTKADLYFSPAADLSGQSLTVTVAYNNTKSDQGTVIAGHTDPNLAMPAPAPVSLTWGVASATWIGQDGQNLHGLGDVHVGIAGIPASRTIVSAALSDEAGSSWAFQPGASGSSMTLARLAADPTRADLDFPPSRDESGATLTLRLVLDDGSSLVTRFAGGPSDPALRAPAPAATSIVAHPGDDLNALANQYGSVHLSAGTYTLAAPLVLNKPVSITSDPGTTLLFSQAADAPTWTAAIKIMSGNTTLDGFAVRFAGPIRWNWNVSYSPAVIGTTDEYDGSAGGLKVGLTLSHLDLASPPAASSWEVAPSLMRLVSGVSGRIVDNVLKGGITEMFGGPWTIQDNDYQGTVPNTYAYGVFSVHYSHDLVVSGNHAEPVGPSGKTWRFLVMTQEGIGDVVQGNTVVGIGPTDADTMPNPNAYEVILSESYRLHFEGIPSAISADGWVVQIPTPQGGAAGTGDVLSILSGPQAGQWRMIAQQLGPTTYLLDAPITPGRFAVSIATGFVNETYRGNTVDSRGSSTALDMVLGGNQFGLQVIDNHLLGGNLAFRFEATGTEAPVTWGWSHAPFLGAVISGNILEDTAAGALLDVDHGWAVKSNRGRVYMSATLANNTVVWSAAFLAQRTKQGASAPPQAITLGDSGSTDPGEMIISESGDEMQLPPGTSISGTLNAASATVNGKAMHASSSVLPALLPAPANLALVDDSGPSPSDGITNDDRLRFDPVPGAVGYEYRLGSPGAPPRPLGPATGFQPVGLAEGSNLIFIAAIDASGRAGQPAAIAFTYRSVPPPAVGGLVATPAGQVHFLPVAPGDTYEVLYGSSPVWRPIGSATSFLATTPGGVPPSVAVRAVDPAGNVGPVAVARIPTQAGPSSGPPSGTSAAPAALAPQVGPPSGPPSGGVSSGPTASAPRVVAPAAQTYAQPHTTPSAATPAGGTHGTSPAPVLVHGRRWARHPDPFAHAGRARGLVASRKH